ncbi:DUF6538 domain-containing protein [Pseudorhodobacter sp. W20_MBD10_FR17]|uniref:DUF6538 domain-containing protein n=1 Tax=Pseudorhodobacter sp. W20_MBD10_FR17 TaxID=3240266 RepID=UPI003F9D0055
MTQPKIPHLLLERGRYYYQRKVPLDFHDVIGKKKWREALGPDHLPAVDRVRALTKEHDALLARLENPDERRDHRAISRRAREAQREVEGRAADLGYRRWLSERDLHDPAFFDEDEKSVALVAEMRARPWKSATSLVSALEAERRVEADMPMLRALTDHFGAGEGAEGQAVLPPLPAYHGAIAAAPDRVKAAIKFLPRIPAAMDDDKFHDRLVEIFNAHFGPSVHRSSFPLIPRIVTNSISPSKNWNGKLHGLRETQTLSPRWPSATTGSPKFGSGPKTSIGVPSIALQQMSVTFRSST